MAPTQKDRPEDLPRYRSSAELLSFLMTGEDTMVWKGEDGSFTHEWTAPFDAQHFQYSLTFRQRKVRFWWIHNQLHKLRYIFGRWKR